MRLSLASLRAVAAARLSPEQKLWLSKARHGEFAWQRRLSEPLIRAGEKVLSGFAVDGGETRTVSAEYDAHTRLRENIAEVRAALRSVRVEFVELPRLLPFEPVFVIGLADAGRAYGALRAMREDSGWHITAHDALGHRLSEKKAGDACGAVFSFRCECHISAPNGRTMSTGREAVTVEVWEELGEGQPRADGSTHIPGTLHRRLQRNRPFVEYFTPEMWRTAVEQHDSTVPLGAPHIYSVDEPVDMVFTWVDGEDPVWRRKKQAAVREIDESEINESALSESRFVSRDELRYALRSVEYYASWVNHIYIVTDGQVPSWLDTSHPKITVVDHSEIFKNPGVLPVFNSHAIESQLHHIPGLSEKYLYLNDDVFFMRPVAPELFFTGSGLSKFFPSAAPLDVEPVSSRDLPVLSAAKNGRSYLREKFGRTVTNKLKHTPHPQLKSVLSRMEAENQAIFDEVAASRFRHPDDFSISSALYHFYAYSWRWAIPGDLKYAYMDIARPDAAIYLRRLLRRRDLDVLCLNDTNTDAATVEGLNSLIAEFFADRFPIRSSFEISQMSEGCEARVEAADLHEKSSDFGGKDHSE